MRAGSPLGHDDSELLVEKACERAARLVKSSLVASRSSPRSWTCVWPTSHASPWSHSPSAVATCWRCVGQRDTAFLGSCLHFFMVLSAQTLAFFRSFCR